MRNVLLFMVMLVLCAGLCHAAPKREFLYVTRLDGTVQGFAVRQDGRLTALPFAPLRVDAPENKNDIEHSLSCIAHPDKPILYVSSFRYESVPYNAVPVKITSTLQPFRVDAAGRLTPLTSAPMRPNMPLFSLTVDPKGRFLYAFADDATIIYSVRRDGMLKLVASQDVALFQSDVNGDTVMGGPSLQGDMTITPSGHFAYTYYGTSYPDLNEYEVNQYRILSDGRLRRITVPDDKSGVVGGILVTPDSRHIYFVGDTTTYYSKLNRSGIRQFRVRKNGTLVPLSPLVGGKETDSAFITHDGKNLYAATQNGYQVYCIRKNGTLLRSFYTPCEQDATTLDPTGCFLYGIQRGGDSPPYTYRLLAYQLTQIGSLRRLPDIPLAGDSAAVSFAVVQK